MEDIDEVVLQFKYAFDLYEVFGDRFLDILYSQLKETSWKADEIEIFKQRGLSQSVWYSPELIEDKCRRAGFSYEKISKELF